MKKQIKRCIRCNQTIPAQRLKILPNTTRCVNCSTTQPKGGISVTKGEGDHTYNETIIMDHDEYVKYKETEAHFYNKPFDPAEFDDSSDTRPELPSLDKINIDDIDDKDFLDIDIDSDMELE